MNDGLDQKYLQLLIDRIEVCRSYKPRFGQAGAGITLAEFQALYGADPFYAWFGLDNSLMYTAHRAAGGITSVYRQIGLGVEELFREIIRDHLGLTTEQSSWSYEMSIGSGQPRVLTLDGRIEPGNVADPERRQIIDRWMRKATEKLRLDEQVAQAMRGVVIEVRQGYKSKDSKRQNADMANAAAAYTQGYLPVLIMLSTQVDISVIQRYERGKWLVLRGIVDGEDTSSTYMFVKQVIGYDLAAFFRSNTDQLKNLTESILNSLLRANQS